METKPAEEISFYHLSQLGQQKRVCSFIALLCLRQPQRPPLFFDFSVRHFHNEGITSGFPLNTYRDLRNPFDHNFGNWVSPVINEWTKYFSLFGFRQFMKAVTDVDVSFIPFVRPR